MFLQILNACDRAAEWPHGSVGQSSQAPEDVQSERDEVETETFHPGLQKVKRPFRQMIVLTRHM